jgi:hypothetical protein
VAVSWKLAGNQWNYMLDTSKLTAGTSIHLRLPVGTGKSSAELDGAALKAGMHQAKHQGRWLDMPLNLGEHRGFW